MEICYTFKREDMMKDQKPWLMMGIIFLLLLGVVGFSTYQNYKLKQQFSQTPPKPLMFRLLARRSFSVGGMIY